MKDTDEKKAGSIHCSALLENTDFSLMASVDQEEAVAIQDIARRLGISGTALVETASEIYFGSKSLPGVSFRSLLAASVYASCRLFGVPRTLKDVSSASGVEVTPLGRSYRKVVQNADLKMPVQDPVRYVPGIASRAGLDARTERRAIEIVGAAKKLGVMDGRIPTAIAAAALYKAYTELHPEESLDPNERVTQTDIADAAGVCELTLRNRMWTIRDVVEKELTEVATEGR